MPPNFGLQQTKSRIYYRDCQTYIPDEQAEYGDHARMVVREAVAKRVREAQYPLANRHARNDSVDDVRREV